MRVAIRADATALSGVGHAMRCLALAEGFAESGDRIHWIGGLASQPWLAQKVSEITTSIEEPAESESEQANQILEIDPDITIVDSYILGEAFCSAVQHHRNILIAIVDSASHLGPADMYVSPSVEPVSPNIVGEAPILQGVEYVLIRSDLRRIKEHIVRSRQLDGAASRPRRIAVLMGGTDVAGMAPVIVESLLSLDVPVSIDAAPRPMQLSPTPKQLDHNGASTVTWWSPGEDFYQQLVEADLVISAAGVSSWEFLYLELPLALVRVADNQASNYQWMTSQGHAVALGESTSLQDPRVLQAALRELLEVDLGATRSRAPIVDGLGVQRIVDGAHQRARGISS
jgi:spore coat polysaccharide biosynthesis predicted glycosyltransferase SpsG